MSKDPARFVTCSPISACWKTYEKVSFDCTISVSSTHSFFHGRGGPMIDCQMTSARLSLAQTYSMCAGRPKSMSRMTSRDQSPARIPFSMGRKTTISLSNDLTNIVACSTYSMRAGRPEASCQLARNRVSPARNPFSLGEKTGCSMSNDQPCSVTRPTYFLRVGRSKAPCRKTETELSPARNLFTHRKTSESLSRDRLVNVTDALFLWVGKTST